MTRHLAWIETPRTKTTNWFGWFLFFFFALLLVGLLAPVMNVASFKGDLISNERATMNQITAAINSYASEYGHLPGNRADGRYEDVAGNAQIFAVLRALDQEQNPRQIVYFEERNAKLRKNFWGQNAKLANGFDPQTGALLDPYGQPYRIRVTPRSQMHAEIPYTDVPAIRSEVVVWSTGPDGKQGSSNNPQKFAGSDDIYPY